MCGGVARFGGAELVADASRRASRLGRISLRQPQCVCRKPTSDQPGRAGQGGSAAGRRAQRASLPGQQGKSRSRRCRRLSTCTPGASLRAIRAPEERRRSTRPAALPRRSSGLAPDYCLFSALKEAHQGAHWTSWETGLRRRAPAALERAKKQLDHRVRFFEFLQLAFDRQWQALREHCQGLGLALLGDVPMFVAHDGADVWSHPELFYLDRDGRMTSVAGVPPDVFSKTGQLWGNPLYRWKRMQSAGFEWWLRRMRVTLSRFDAVRLDHFIGFHRYWEVAASATTAKEGRFVPVPGDAFFDAAKKHLGGLPFVAEDLGIVTDEVCALRDRFSLPGMRVLEFAFGERQRQRLSSSPLPAKCRRVYRHPRQRHHQGLVSRPVARQAAGEGAGAPLHGTKGKEIHWDLIDSPPCRWPALHCFRSRTCWVSAPKRA